MYFPTDDVVRVTLVMRVLMEKRACRDSTEKPGNWAEKEKQVRKTNLTDCFEEEQVVEKLFGS